MGKVNSDDKSALVVGLGKTGLSCVRFLDSQGYRVSVVDSRDIPPMLNNFKTEFPDLPISTGGFRRDIFLAAETIILSPGVSRQEKYVRMAEQAGAIVIGDVELFARQVTQPVVAITGSNGKSTVTALLGEMCQGAGMNAPVAGNIGLPVLDLLRDPDCASADLYVVELSSFQLETTRSLKPCAAVVLNLSADHMDRYTDMDAYSATKARIFQGEGLMVINRQDPVVRAMSKPDRDVVSFGLDAPEEKSDYGIQTDATARWLVRGQEKIMRTDEVRLLGPHNWANVLAAMALAHRVGVPQAKMIEAARRFSGLPHRTEIIAEVDGVLWINDSKATNVGATVAALRGMERPVVLLAGGEGKDADFSLLRELVKDYVRSVILFGRDAEQIARALDDTVPLSTVRDLEHAVSRAGECAQRGDCVLLSPACASFDMFQSFEHRGDRFRQLVQEEVACRP